MMYDGDGIVSHRDSYLPGATVEILPADPSGFSRAPDQYCHIQLPRNPEVMDRVRGYLNTMPVNPPSSSTGPIAGSTVPGSFIRR